MEKFVNYEKISIFEASWSNYDPKGKGFIQVSDLMDVLQDLGAPLGLDKTQSLDYDFL